MFKKAALTLIGLGISLISVTASATVIIDTVNFNGFGKTPPLVWKAGRNSSSYDYTHTFDLKGEQIVSASLEVWVADDTYFGKGDPKHHRREAGEFRAISNGMLIDSFSSLKLPKPAKGKKPAKKGGGTTRPAPTEPNYWRTLGTTDLNSWILDLADNNFSINVLATKGDFWFKQSRLTITTEPTKRVKTVPEPESLILFSLGLLGLTRLKRRRKSLI